MLPNNTPQTPEQLAIMAGLTLAKLLFKEVLRWQGVPEDLIECVDKEGGY